MENNSNYKQVNKNSSYIQINLGLISPTAAKLIQTINPIFNNAWIQTANGYTIFSKDVFIKAQEEGERMTLIDIATAWKNSDERTKDRYEALARENKERDKMRELNKAGNERSLGPYEYYLIDLYEKNKFMGFFADAAKSWKDLSEEERSKYINQAEQAQYAHEVKDEDKNPKANLHLIYLWKIRRIITLKMSH
jgi:hypothetical protein